MTSVLLEIRALAGSLRYCELPATQLGSESPSSYNLTFDEIPNWIHTNRESPDKSEGISKIRESSEYVSGENHFSILWASRGRSYYQNPSRKLPGYRTLLLDEFQHGIFYMDPFRADYYSFWDPQNWPKLSPAPKTDFLLEQLFGTSGVGLFGTLRS